MNKLQLHPLASHRRLWLTLSQGLVVGGGLLLLLGGVQLYGYYEALSHPPAPVINSVAAFSSPTLTPVASALPTLTPSPNPPTPTRPKSSATPSPTATPADFFPKFPLRSATATPVTAAPITRLVAKSIELDTEVIQVSWVTWTTANGVEHVWQVADYAAGWHKNSALPGQGGNIVLSGHHNMNGEVFRDIVKLSVGDKVTLYEGKQPFNYEVTEKFIVKDLDEPEEVRRANARWIGPFDEERLTLVTCWPYIGNTHRVIVIAKPISD